MSIIKTKIIRKTIGSEEEDFSFEYSDPINKSELESLPVNWNKVGNGIDFTDNSLFPKKTYKYEILVYNSENLETNYDFINSFTVTTKDKPHIEYSSDLELESYTDLIDSYSGIS